MIYPSTQSKAFLPVIYKAESKWLYSENKVYLDFIGGNNTVILGHKRYKLDYPPNFSGTSFLEDKTSEVLSKLTNTNYFRYFKNGSDAVSCALRLARHLLEKDGITSNKAKILFIGYAGSCNEYAYTINKNGIPYQNTVQLCPDAFMYVKDSFSFYDIVVFESRYKDVADTIPSKYKICDHLKSGVLGLFEKTYDIDLYGKSLGNGYPVSVLTGKDSILKEINNIYYSTTFGGDNVGLEAINKTLKEFMPLKNNYIDFLEYAKERLPKWGSLTIEQVNSFLDKGIFFNGNWQLMTCHTKRDVDKLALIIKEFT